MEPRHLPGCFAAGNSLLTYCGVCLLVGGATRIVTQVAWYNFYNDACSACGVLSAPMLLTPAGVRDQVRCF